MALPNIFKRRKPAKKKVEEKKELKEKKIKEEGPEELPSVVQPRRVREKGLREAYRILKSPHITEKATDLASKNQYTFNVWERTNKIEIKKAIEDTYGVDVESVKIIRIHPKQRRLGRVSGWRKGYKKAIVKIAKGQKIEVLPR